MQSLYDIAAPAKLNLFLHVTGRRADGYHLLQSVFMLIDWCDTLHFELREDGHISREDLTWELPPDDLVVRAARALQTFAPCAHGAHIGVAKSVPAQAGMGGGSSDAASTLLALNRLWKLNLPLTTLMHLGLRLGADVPFFLGGHHAWVEGIGEKITPIALPKSQCIVVKPAAGLDTRLIFSDPDLKRDSEADTIMGFATATFNSGLNFGKNDLQGVAQKLCPSVTLALDWLASIGLVGRMTGSGSAVFAHLPQGDNLELLGRLSSVPKGFQIKLCSSLDAHPLKGWADSEGLSVGSG